MAGAKSRRPDSRPGTGFTRWVTHRANLSHLDNYLAVYRLRCTLPVQSATGSGYARSSQLSRVTREPRPTRMCNGQHSSRRDCDTSPNPVNRIAPVKPRSLMYRSLPGIKRFVTINRSRSPRIVVRRRWRVSSHRRDRESVSTNFSLRIEQFFLSFFFFEREIYRDLSRHVNSNAKSWLEE